MAGAGYRSFSDGAVLTATQVQTFLMDQAVMVFAGTAARGSALPTPSEGMICYLQDTDAVQVYNGSSWSTLGQAPAVLSSPSATGTYTASGTAWTYYTFNATGTAVVSTSGLADVLIVGGGGGGGGDGSAGQGGAAGGYVHRTSMYLTAGTYTMTVGAGGAGNSSGFPFNYGAMGSDSAAFGVTAVGGGGASASTNTSPNGGSSTANGRPIVGQGTQGTGAQGGGSSNADGTGTSNSIINNSATTFAAGKNATTGGAGTANRGDGGQGGSTGFNGGSGIVVIRVRS